MSRSITTKDFNSFLNDLIRRLPVYGPKEDKNGTFSKYRFTKLISAGDLAIPYTQTVTPPKKYLFPARMGLFEYEKGEVLAPKNKEFVLFGVNKRDGEGLFYLDQIMTKPIKDEDYALRRSMMKLVIIDNLPPSNALNCDLYLQKVDQGHYLAFTYTEFGEQLIQNKYFGHQAQTGTISGRNLPDEVIFHPRLDSILENSRNHPVWEELAETCFNCGICSYVCPLCYCFEIEDKVKITKDTAKEILGQKEARWDSCMLPDFAKVSFKNYRPEFKDRIYNWYYHKFVRMPRELGFPGCVDCTRCTHFCPAGINFRDVLKRLIKDEKK